MVHFEIYRDLLFGEKKCFYSTKIEEYGNDKNN